MGEENKKAGGRKYLVANTCFSISQLFAFSPLLKNLPEWSNYEKNIGVVTRLASNVHQTINIPNEKCPEKRRLLFRAEQRGEGRGGGRFLFGAEQNGGLLVRG